MREVGNVAHPVLQFGEYRGATLFQVAQTDPDYLRSLALTAQRPQVRAAAIPLVRADTASRRMTPNAQPNGAPTPVNITAPAPTRFVATALPAPTPAPTDTDSPGGQEPMHYSGG